MAIYRFRPAIEITIEASNPMIAAAAATANRFLRKLIEDAELPVYVTSIGSADHLTAIDARQVYLSQVEW
jgi:hypothetical protein